MIIEAYFYVIQEGISTNPFLFLTSLSILLGILFILIRKNKKLTLRKSIASLFDYLVFTLVLGFLIFLVFVAYIFTEPITLKEFIIQSYRPVLFYSALVLALVVRKKIIDRGVKNTNKK